MIPIEEFLNKMINDETEDPEDYVFYYLDDISRKLIPIEFNDVLSVDDKYLKLRRKEQKLIPTRQIIKIMKNNKIVWKR
jgi:uncharacterized protein (UPF0248 family)